MIDINNLKKILSNSNLVVIELIDKEGLKNSYDPFNEDDQKFLLKLLKKFESPLVIEGFKGKIFILRDELDEIVIHENILKYCEIIKIIDKNKNQLNGINYEELKIVRKHILKSSYFCRFYMLLDFFYLWKISILIVTLVLILFLKKIGLNTILIYSITIPIFIFIVMVSIYIIEYHDRIVNDLTFDILSTHEPTMKFIFSGQFENKKRDDLTNIILYMSYKNTKRIENEIRLDDMKRF